MTFLSPQSGSDCGADLCRKGLGKCDRSIDNVALAIPIVQSNSSPKCEGFVVPVCRHHGWWNGHVVIQMSFQPVSDKDLRLQNRRSILSFPVALIKSNISIRCSYITLDPPNRTDQLFPFHAKQHRTSTYFWALDLKLAVRNPRVKLGRSVRPS